MRLSRPSAAPRGWLVKRRVGKLRAQISAARRNAADGLDEVARRPSFQDIAVHACSKCRGHVLRLLVTGEQDDPDCLRLSLQLAGGIEARQPRHAEIEHGY